MKWDEYVHLTERTANRGPQDSTARRLVMCALGLVGETGEVADACKKTLFHDHAFDRDHFLQELGDLLWYVAIAASTVGADLSVSWQEGEPTESAPFEDSSLLDHAITLSSLVSVAAEMLYAMGRRSEHDSSENFEMIVAANLAPVLRSICLMANNLGTNIKDVAERNINKLRKRYPNGFDSEHSIHRAV